MILMTTLAAYAFAADPKIVGGEAAGSAWPQVAALLQGGEAVCSGVLIAPNVVLSAGHCGKRIDEVLLKAESLTGPGETIEVSEVVRYPKHYASYDLEVLILERESSVQPATIVQDCVLDELVDGAAATIVGYGATDRWGANYVDELLQAQITITDPDCEATERGCIAEVSPGGELGAGGDGKDTCYGDSGGPIFLNTDQGDFLVGITSRGWDDVTVDCGQGGIYVRPDAVLAWLEDAGGWDLAEPDCGQGVISAEPREEGPQDVGGCSALPVPWTLAFWVPLAAAVRRRRDA
jgi:secreted trypsin-like serine protease